MSPVKLQGPGILPGFLRVPTRGRAWHPEGGSPCNATTHRPRAVTPVEVVGARGRAKPRVVESGDVVVYNSPAMPITGCPRCGHDFQYPESFAGTSVQCPGCGQPMLLPNLDGSMPVEAPPLAPPPLPTRAGPAASYYLRHPGSPEVVVGPLPRDRLRRMVKEGKVKPDDELSADKKVWRTAERIDPQLFGRRPLCPGCGAGLDPGVTECPVCALAVPVEEDSEGSYGLVGGPLAAARGRELQATKVLTDFVSARGTDAVVAVSRDGWLGNFSAADERLRRVWDFDAAKRVHVAVAGKGKCAVLAAGDGRSTRIYLADFDTRRLPDVAELDGPIRALAIRPDGRELALVDDEESVRVYQVDPWKRLDKFPLTDKRQQGERVFEFCLKRDLLATADDRGRVLVWDLREARVDQELLTRGGGPACPKRPLRLGFSRSGDRLFAATGGLIAAGSPEAGSKESTIIRGWDVERGKQTAELTDVWGPHPTGIADVFFWPWGSAVATVGEASVHAWDIATGENLGAIYQTSPEAETDPKTSPTSRIRRIDFTRDGDEALVLVSGAKEIRVIPWPKSRVRDAES
jgi:hypothetical protein